MSVMMPVVYNNYQLIITGE